MSDKLVRICNRVVEDTTEVDLKKGELLLDISSANHPAVLISDGTNVHSLNDGISVKYTPIILSSEAFNTGTNISIIKYVNLSSFKTMGYQEVANNIDKKFFISISIPGYSEADFYVIMHPSGESDVEAIHDLKLTDSLILEPIYSLTDANQEPVCYCTIVGDIVKIYGRNIYDFSDNNSYDNFPIPDGTLIKITAIPVVCPVSII